MRGSDPHDHGIRVEAHRKDAWLESILTAANRALAQVDLPPAPAGPAPESLPLIYIVGVPRSGTTLLHQLVARHLDVAYVDNIVARFWLRPSVGIAVSRALGRETSSIELRSSHGVTGGMAGPHEFGYFWRRWLPLDDSPNHHLSPALRATVDREGLRGQLLQELLAPAGRPFAFKNVICGFHAALLTQIHPRSLFVHITRDLATTARSILAARHDRYGSFETWWSLEPSTYPYPAGSSPAEQVVRQVRDCRADFDRALAAPGIHSLEVSYDGLCGDPLGTLEAIRSGVRSLGWDLPPIAGDPGPLRPSAGPELPAQMASEVERIAHEELIL